MKKLYLKNGSIIKFKGKSKEKYKGHPKAPPPFMLLSNNPNNDNWAIKKFMKQKEEK